MTRDAVIFDASIIGVGQAAGPLATKLQQAGWRVALVERKHLGGSCVNFGCTPTKTALASARVAHLARRAAEFGVKIAGLEVNFAAVMQRARDSATQSRANQDKKFEGSENPLLFRGHARLEGRDGEHFKIRVEDRVLLTKRVILNTGTRSRLPNIDGLESVPFIHAGNWLELNECPEHLLIVGAGAIGLEMSQFYRRMGAQVTLLSSGPHIGEHEDADVAQAMQGVLEAEGIKIESNTKASRLEQTAAGLRLTLQNGSSLEGSHVFVATGRQPNTDDLGLDTIGLVPREDGTINVTPQLETVVPNVFAVGDIRGGPQYTSSSWDDHRVLESKLLGDGSHTTKRIVPYGIFTDPELGRVGLTETEARASHAHVRVAHYDLEHSGRANEMNEARGCIKIVIDGETNLLLGAAVLAPGGGELVHVFSMLMIAGAPYTVLRDAVQAHPTLAESLQSAVSSLE
jgi:pyruvate/2-oxoglutarate dehydrogenase complex dihydrolipoamide dehydrogenase (E3) component